MTQDERWNKHYQEIVAFITEHKRRPSKYRTAEHPMLNWMKYCRKLIAQNKLSEDRVAKFNALMELADKFQRKNQYRYAYNSDENPDLWDEASQS